MTNRGRPPLLSEETILEKALAAFASSGYSAMSVRALNAELGVSHETISKRFGSKSELFRAAVGHGVALFIAELNEEHAKTESTDDLSQLRATVRSFMVAISHHPTLGDLLHHESIDEAQRMVFFGHTGLSDRITDTATLLQRLHGAGIIHETKIRELWSLIQGAVEPLHFHALAQIFDAFDGPVVAEELLDRMTDAIMRSMVV
jgi:AcrR family transcriptional regulator